MTQGRKISDDEAVKISGGGDNSDADWDTIMFVITGTDRLNHYLWEDYADTSSPHHQTFLDFYHEVDQQIHRITERLGDETTIIAVSDHGFGPQLISVNVNYLLHEHGLLQLESRRSLGRATCETRRHRGRARLPGRECASQLRPPRNGRSLSPSLYSHALSMKLTPASMAVRIRRTPSASSGTPMWKPPTPRMDTSSPVLPNAR